MPHNYGIKDVGGDTKEYIANTYQSNASKPFVFSPHYINESRGNSYSLEKRGRRFLIIRKLSGLNSTLVGAGHVPPRFWVVN